MGVTVSGEHLKYAVAELKYGDIESTATEVVNGNLHILVLLVKSVCKGGCSWLVDDTFHIESGNLSCFLGSLTLRVREVCRDSNDCLRNRLTQIIFRGLFHLLEYDGRNLLRRIELAVNVNARSIVVSTYYLVRHTGNLLAYLIVGLAHETLD